MDFVVDNELYFCNEDPVDTKLKELHLLVDQKDTLDSFTVGHYNSMLSIFEYLKSNEVFLFSFNRNQIINYFVLDALEILILSGQDQPNKTTRDEGLRLLVQFLETTLLETVDGSYENEFAPLKYSYSSLWVKEFYEAFFTKILTKSSFIIHQIISEKDSALIPTVYKLVVFTILSVDLQWLHRTDQWLMLFLEFLFMHAERFPKQHLIFINSLLGELFNDTISVGRLNNTERMKFLEVYNLIMKSFEKLYDVYKSDVDKKMNLNNMIFGFNDLLYETLMESEYLVFGGLNTHYLQFTRSIFKFMSGIIDLTLKVAKNEVISNVANLAYVDQTYEHIYLSIVRPYYTTPVMELHRIPTKTVQNKNHDHLLTLIRSLKAISKKYNSEATHVEKSCLKIINLIVSWKNVNMEFVATVFWNHLESYWPRFLKLKDFTPLAELLLKYESCLNNEKRQEIVALFRDHTENILS